jgi:NitT/TauT family transport system substrate-binding protein
MLHATNLSVRGIAALALAAVALAVAAGWPGSARAEATEIRIAKADGISYLPFMMIERFNLIEKEAEKVGAEEREGLLGAVRQRLGHERCVPVGQCRLRRNRHAGIPDHVGQDEGKHERPGVAAMNSIPMILNTIDPAIKNLKDIKESDRIALAGVKVSVTAIVLQMAAEQAFGKDKALSLDRQTVSMSHPDAMIALLGGKSEIKLHFTSPPFSTLELKNPGVHSILNSNDVLGGPATYVMVQTTEKFHRENPKLYGAFLAALKQSIAMIKANPREAAETYMAIVKGKETAEELMAILREPSVEFTTTPNAVLKYAKFMKEIGTLKNSPVDWKELFLPAIHGESGS